MQEIGTVKVQTEKTIQASIALKNSLETLQVQQLLRDNNLYQGRLDGKLDTKTLNSLRKLQQRKGISSTGKLDSKTRRALKLEPIENFPNFK
ncbi:MAG: peptidoglycan-binding protein [Aestuariibacter sp.]|nr:peptidoglycan-binding protein [Aestuariibacter sp.]